MASSLKIEYQHPFNTKIAVSTVFSTLISPLPPSRLVR